MSESKRSETSKRRTVLGAVEPGQVRAMVEMQETDPETLAGLVTMVNVMTRGETDGGDVAALAVLTAPALWVSRRDESMPPVAVAAVAVRKARRTLAGLAREAAETVADGDVLVEAVEAGDVSLSMGRGWCPSPESRYVPTWGDALATLVATLPAEVDRAWLAEAASAWLTLEGQGRMDGAGRPVTLAGAVPMVRGWKASQAGYGPARRAVLAALAALPVGTVDDVLARMDVLPGEVTPHGANRVSVGNGTGAHEPQAWESVVRSVVLRDALGYPAALGYGTDALGYGAALGYDDGCAVVESYRRVTDREAERVGTPDAGRVERLAAPETADDHAAGFPGETVHLPSRKVAPSPRKRGGSGATGPVVPARLAR